jgi:hypothetical protein
MVNNLADVVFSNVAGLMQHRDQPQESHCRMDLPGPTTSVGTRTDYMVGPWDYPAWAAQHLFAWSTRISMKEYSDRRLYMTGSM